MRGSRRPGIAAALDASDRPPSQGAWDCAVPFTLTNLKQDLEDVGSNFDGPPDLEFRMATQALELKQSGLSFQRDWWAD